MIRTEKKVTSYYSRPRFRGPRHGAALDPAPPTTKWACPALELTQAERTFGAPENGVPVPSRPVPHPTLSPTRSIWGLCSGSQFTRRFTCKRVTPRLR